MCQLMLMMSTQIVICVICHGYAFRKLYATAFTTHVRTTVSEKESKKTVSY